MSARWVLLVATVALACGGRLDHVPPLPLEDASSPRDTYATQDAACSFCIPDDTLAPPRDVHWADVRFDARDCRSLPKACAATHESSPKLAAERRLAAGMLACEIECGSATLEIDEAGCAARLAAFKRGTAASSSQLECLARLVEPYDWSGCGGVIEAMSGGCGPK